MDENERIYYEVNKGYWKVAIYFLIGIVIVTILHELDLIINHNGLDILKYMK